MSDGLVSERLHGLLRRELDWEGEALPTGELGVVFDSLELMALMVAVEDEFSIEFLDDAQALETVEALILYVEERVLDERAES